MIIVQISDIHIDETDPARTNAARLAVCLDEIARVRPTAVLATGDLVEHGTAAEYAMLRAMFGRVEAPIYAIPGNHDARPVFLEAFAADGYVAASAAFAHHAVATGPLQIVALDTVVPGSPGGDLCARRLDWLVTALERQPETPTLLVMHHPPCATGIRYMDAMGLAVEAGTRLGSIVRRHPQIIRIVCGHVHRPLFAAWGGTIVSVCPSIARLGRLDLTPGVDDAASREPPAFQVHAWDNETLVTHTVSATVPKDG